MITAAQKGTIKPLHTFKVVNQNKSHGASSDYMVFWRITESCNLECDYCHWYDKGVAPETIEDLQTIVDELFDFFKQAKLTQVLFYYHGGEPTRISFLDKIIDYITEMGLAHNVKVSHELQTNLICNQKTLSNLISKVDMLNISPHYSQYIDKPQIKKVFEKNMKYIMDNNISIHNFDIMLEDLDEEHTQKFKDWISKYLKYEHLINSEMIYNYWRVDNNTKLKEIYKEFYDEFNITRQTYSVDGVIYDTNELFGKGLDAVGMRCEAGQKSIMLLGSGNVFVCGRPMTDFLNRLPESDPYTNILTDKHAKTKLLVLYKFGTVCDSDECGGEYYLKKKIIK
jgi:organic radical activating enzyme